MTQVKTNSTQTQLSTSKIHPSLLSRHEVIWIQYFHWPNVTTWAYKAQAQEKRKILTLVLISASGPFSRWNKNYCVFRLVFVSRMKANKRKQLSVLISFSFSPESISSLYTILESHFGRIQDFSRWRGRGCYLAVAVESWHMPRKCRNLRTGI